MNLVTKDDIDRLKDRFYGSLYTDIWAVMDRLLAERDAYQSVSISIATVPKYIGEPADEMFKRGRLVHAEARLLTAGRKRK